MKKILTITILLAVVFVGIYVPVSAGAVYESKQMVVITVAKHEDLGGGRARGVEGGQIANIVLDNEVKVLLCGPDFTSFIVPANKVTLVEKEGCKMLSGKYEEKRDNVTYTLTFENVRLCPSKVSSTTSARESKKDASASSEATAIAKVEIRKIVVEKVSNPEVRVYHLTTKNLKPLKKEDLEGIEGVASASVGIIKAYAVQVEKGVAFSWRDVEKEVLNYICKTLWNLPIENVKIQHLDRRQIEYEKEKERIKYWMKVLDMMYNPPVEPHK
ncbi:MAG: hypothetical protein NTY20_04230 [Candidatus Aenigmarchaeota archaeon]|nr:hypothetical protein [Candidatus Aenigmarchaeota archaeon]